jgi:hypothetical protein
MVRGGHELIGQRPRRLPRPVPKNLVKSRCPDALVSGSGSACIGRKSPAAKRASDTRDLFYVKSAESPDLDERC